MITPILICVLSSDKGIFHASTNVSVDMVSFTEEPGTMLSVKTSSEKFHQVLCIMVDM